MMSKYLLWLSKFGRCIKEQFEMCYLAEKDNKI